MIGVAAAAVGRRVEGGAVLNDQARLHSAIHVLTTTPNVPQISGRVVKRLGLTKLMGITQFACATVLRHRSV
jgi:hypothetical protein